MAFPTKAANRRIELALLLGLWLLVTWALYLVAGSTKGSYDTFRDLWYAASIKGGHYFPAEGPGINRVFHLGPMWFYLLAGISWLVPPMQAVLLLGAAAAAAKFPLAFIAGRELGDRWTGLFAVTIIALPGWWFFELGVLTHTSAVAAAILFLVYMAAATAKSPSAGRFVLLGVACSLAFHAHPTTVVSGVIACGVSLQRVPADKRVGPILLIGAFPLLSVLPYLLGGGLGADLEQIAHYGSQTIAASMSPLRLPTLALSVAVGGAFYAFWIWLDLSFAQALAASVLIWLPVLVAVGCAMKYGVARDRWAVSVILLGTFAAQCVFLIVVRDITPVWMVFSLYPLLALALSAVIAPLAGAARLPAVVALACIAITAIVSSGFALHRMARQPASFTIPSYPPGSAGLMSVTEVPIGKRVVAPLYYTLFALPGRLPVTCEPTRLHGSLALLADASLGYPWTVSCGSFDGIALGGAPSPGSAAVFAVWDEPVLRHCSLQAGASSVPPASFPAVVRNLTPPIPLGDPRRYPPRTPDLTFGQQHSTLDSVRSRFLYVGNLLPAYYPMEIERVLLDGREVAPVSVTDVASVYECRRCSESAPGTFEITYRAAAGGVDLVEFDCPGRDGK